MDQNPPVGAGGSGRPLAAVPDHRPYLDNPFVPEAAAPPGQTVGAPPGPGLDYGPVPDHDAARDYAMPPDYSPAPLVDREREPDPAPAKAPALGTAPVTGAAPVPVAATPVAAPEPAAAPDTAAGGAFAVATAPAPAAGPRVSGPAAAWVSRDAGHWAPGQVSSATYWRRRAVALVVGMAVLAVLAWAASGTLGASGAATPGGATRGGSTQAHRSPHHGTVKRHGPSASGAHGPQSLPGAISGYVRTTSALATSSSRPKGSARAPQRVVARAPRAQMASCSRGDVVLTLVSPRYSYARGARPLFGVEAVSTGARACRFDMGSRVATVVVTSGRTRIWGSADCARGNGSLEAVLTRGVPAVRWVTWDLRISAPGCRVHGRPLRQGAYAAIAFDGLLTSKTMVFLLGHAP